MLRLATIGAPCEEEKERDSVKRQDKPDENQLRSSKRRGELIAATATTTATTLTCRRNSYTGPAMYRLLKKQQGVNKWYGLCHASGDPATVVDEKRDARGKWPNEAVAAGWPQRRQWSRVRWKKLQCTKVTQ